MILDKIGNTFHPLDDESLSDIGASSKPEAERFVTSVPLQVHAQLAGTHDGHNWMKVLEDRYWEWVKKKGMTWRHATKQITIWSFKKKIGSETIKKKKKGGDDRNLKESCQVFSFSINRKWSTDLKKQKIFFVSKRTATVWASTTRNNSRLNRRKVRTPVTGCFYLSFV